MGEDVVCEVKNCDFWKDGKVCGGEGIYMVRDRGNEGESERERDCESFVHK